MAGGRDERLLASHDFLGLDGVAIDECAGFIVGTKSGACEGDAGKQTAGARVAEDFGAHPGVGIGGSVTSERSGSNGSIAAELNLAAENGFHPSVVHDQEDQVGGFAADLEADTAAFQGVHGRGAPRSTELIAGAANHGTAAVFRTDAER